MSITEVSPKANRLATERMKMERLVDACRTRGMRVTPQRLAVYRVVSAATSHPAVEQVWREVRQSLPSISLDTVYRTLESLERLGLVRRLNPLEKVRYDGNTGMHHHFICAVCGDIIDVHTPPLPKPTEEVCRCGEITSMALHIHGVCRRCAAQSRSAERPTAGKS